MDVNRRTAVVGGLGALAALAIPSVTHATIAHDPLFERARREVERAGNRLWLRDRVAIADFSKPSSVPRFFVLDMASGSKTEFLVAHGRGSDPEHDGWLKSFSNQHGSLATSRGAYLAGTWYEGKYGTSMRLSGLDADNDQAEDRAIVVHGAWYANPDMIEKWGKLGRSEGCFAVPADRILEFIGRLGPGRLLIADRIGAA